MNKKFVNHMQYSWWCYVAILVAVLVVWTSVYAIIQKPNANEQLVISYFGTDYEWKKLNDDVTADVKNFTSQNIKKVTVDYVDSQNQTLLGQMLQTRLYSSDLIVFNDGVVDDEFVKMSFAPITHKMQERLEEVNLQYFQIDGVNYGVYLCKDNLPNNKFSQYYGGSKQCVAFFAPYSQNVGAIYGNGNEQDDAAISLLKYLLESPNA